MSEPTYIYKICTISEWEKFQKSGVFSGNDLDQKTGYLHLSLPRQLPRIVGKYFSEAKDIIFLQVPIEGVKALVKWEPNSQGDLFPHFYGDLKLSYISRTFNSLEDLLLEDPIQEADLTA